MDIPLDQFDGRQAGRNRTEWSALSASGAGCTALDWRGLIGRLSAAHAAREALGFQPHPAGKRPGSFAPDMARDLAAWRATSSSGINLDIKADGKTLRTIGRIDAGEDRFLVEGCYDRRSR